MLKLRDIFAFTCTFSLFLPPSLPPTPLPLSLSLSYLQSYLEWTEGDVDTWMKALHLDAYSSRFKKAGIRRGTDLQILNDSTLLDRVDIKDEFHRLIILECLKELQDGSSSSVRKHPS